MDEQRKRTEITLTILAIFLVIAGISVVVFLSVSNNYISPEKDWSLILLVYFIIIAPMVFLMLFPALLGEPFFTRTREEWDDPFEREIILDIPYQSAFDRCLDSVSLLMMGRTFDSLMLARDARIIVNDRKNGVITVITNDKGRSFAWLPFLAWFADTPEYRYLVPEKTRTLTDAGAR